MAKFFKDGFTLAEILITLGVIGVVAAMTMPTLIQNHKKHVVETKLKKAYSIFSQAFQLAIAENGEVNTWEYLDGAYSIDNTVAFTEKYLVPYLKVVKNCKEDTTGECEINVVGLNGATNVSGVHDAYPTKIILADGIYAIIGIGNKSFIQVNIGINEKKTPAILGKDIFDFEYYVAGKKFVSRNSTKSVDFLKESACNKNKVGIGCASLIIKEGWKITDDYPW